MIKTGEKEAFWTSFNNGYTGVSSEDIHQRCDLIGAEAACCTSGQTDAKISHLANTHILCHHASPLHLSFNILQEAKMRSPGRKRMKNEEA